MDFLFSRGAIMAEEEPKQDQTAEPSGSQAGKAQEGAGPELASNTDRLTLKEVIAQQRAKLKEEANEKGALSHENAAVPDDDEPAPERTGEGRIEEGSGEPSPEDVPPEMLEADGRDDAEPQETPADEIEQIDQDSVPAQPAEPAADEPDADATAATPAAKPRGRWAAMLPLVLGLNTIVIAAVAVAVFSYRPSPAPSDGSIVPGTTSQPGAAQDTGPVAVVTPESAGPVNEDTQPLAEKAYRAGKYRVALPRYLALYSDAKSRPADALIRGFFAARAAACLVELGRLAEARGILQEPCQSGSPIVRAAANRELALIDALEGQHLSARRRAYAALGVLGAMETPQVLEVDCEYLIAWALTAAVLSASGAELEIPWHDVRAADPFAVETDLALRRLLGQGARRLAGASISPSLRRQPGPTPSRDWVAAWSGPLLKDLLHRVSADDGPDIRWLCGGAEGRRASLTVVFRKGVPEQKLTEVACGAVGLLARFTGDQIVVHSPRLAKSMKVRTGLLAREAVSVWRRLFLSAPNDPRIADGHFALGRLHESTGQTLDAMRIYQLVSRRYRRSRVGPPSLLRSARLRMQLRDYMGARQDLLNMLDKYPDSDSELLGEVYLELGQATRGAGLPDEAARRFQTLYYLGLSLSSRKLACLETALCLVETGRNKDAVKWVTRYLGLAKGEKGEQMARAYLLLGRCSAAVGDMSEAALALQQALVSEPSWAQRIEALTQLVDVQVARRRFVHVIGTLDRLGQEKLDEKQFARYLLLTAKAYRTMGLPQRAVSALRDKLASVPDAKTRALLRIELARCQAARGRLQEARDELTLALAKIHADDEGYAAQCELAEVSLKMGKLEDVIAMARPLLRSSSPPGIRRRAAEVLAAAYVRRGQYEQAIEALSAPATNKATGRKQGAAPAAPAGGQANG